MKSLFKHIGILLLITTFSNVSFSNDEKITQLKVDLNNSTGTERFEILNSISKEYMFTSFILAEKYARIGLNESVKDKDTIYQIRFYRRIGGVKQYSSQYDSAVYYFQKSADMAITINNDYQEAMSKLNMANIFFLTEQYQKAIDIYRNSTRPLLRKKDTTSLALTYNNTGTAYMSLNQLDSAEFYINKALEYKSLLNDRTSFAISLSNLGDIYQLQKQYNRAETQYKTALNIFEEEQSTYNISYACIRLSELYINIGENELSELYLHRAIELSEVVGSIQLKSEAQLKLSELFESISNDKKALEFYKKYKKLNDSIAETKYSSLMNQVSIAFQIEEQERELEILNNEITLKKSKITLLYSLIGFFCVLIAIIIFFYIRINLKNKALFQQSLKEIQTDSIEDENNDPKMEELYNKLFIKLEKEKVYLDSSLTISKLSDLVDSNTNYVSKCINQKYGINFNSILNKYRVKEAKMLFRQNALDNYTMAAIGEMCGFTSISVFNRSFKKETGITPTFFIKSLKTEAQ